MRGNPFGDRRWRRFYGRKLVPLSHIDSVGIAPVGTGQRNPMGPLSFLWIESLMQKGGLEGGTGIGKEIDPYLA